MSLDPFDDENCPWGGDLEDEYVNSAELDLQDEYDAWQESLAEHEGAPPPPPAPEFHKVPFALPSRACTASSSSPASSSAAASCCVTPQRNVQGQVQDDTPADAPKFKRLRGKQPLPANVALPPPPSWQPELPVEADTVPEGWLGVTEKEFNSMNHRARYVKVYNKFLWWLRKAPDAQKEALENVRKASKQQAAALQEAVQADEANQKKNKFEEFLNATEAPPWVRHWSSGRIFEVKKGQEKRWLHSKTVLLTYNGTWGQYKDKKYAPEVDLDTVTREMSCVPFAQDLHRDFVEFIQNLAMVHRVDAWAASTEISTETLKEGEGVRLHCHAFMKKEEDKIQARLATPFVFKGSCPDKRGQLLGMRVRTNGTWAACYYLQCPKRGCVFSAGNKTPFRDYPVNGNWIFSLVQAEKLEYKEARAELVKTGQCLSKRLSDLDKWYREVEQAKLEAHVQERQRALQRQLCPFRRVEAVDNWVLENSTPRMRKRFLVLEGPSGVAKTEFARSIFGTAHTYELNMANSANFCLRKFNPMVHKLILWDEAGPELVSQERKLFQCPACWVDCGQSPTGSHVYRVWLNDACMCIASNKWSQMLKRLLPLDQEWIKNNQVHVMVSESLVAP